MIRTARDSVAIAVLGVDPFEDLRFRRLLEQSGADHGGGNAGRDLGVRCKGAVTEILEDIDGFEQRGSLAIGEGACHLAMLDAHRALRGHPANGERIQVAAIGRLRTRLAVAA